MSTECSSEQVLKWVGGGETRSKVNSLEIRSCQVAGCTTAPWECWNSPDRRWRGWRGGGESGYRVERGGTKSYRFNDQFDIKTSFPKKTRASDQQQEEKTQERCWGGGGNITNFQFKVLPADSPSPQLHKTGLRRTVTGGWRGGGGQMRKNQKTNSSPFTLNTCRNRPRHFFSLF